MKVALSGLSGSSQSRTEGESEDIELPMLPNTDPLSPPTSPVVQDEQLQPAKDQRSFPVQPQVGKWSSERQRWVHAWIAVPAPGAPKLASTCRGAMLQPPVVCRWRICR